MGIGKNIYMLREAKGLSQDELANTVGVSLLAIQSYEKEKWQPGSWIIARLAEALQVNIANLVGNCEEVYDENGDLILIKKDCGSRVSVFGKFKHKDI